MVLGQSDWSGNYTAQILRTNSTYDRGTEENFVVAPQWTIPNFWYHYTQHFTDSSEASTAYTATDSSVGFVFVDTYILSDSFPHTNITKLHWDATKNTIAAAVQIYDWDGSLVHITCGSGSGSSLFGRMNTDDFVVHMNRAGFCHHTLTQKKFTTEFVDGYTGSVMETYSKSRNVRERTLLKRFNVFQTLPEISFVEVPPWKPDSPMENDLFIRIEKYSIVDKELNDDDRKMLADSLRCEIEYKLRSIFQKYETETENTAIAVTCTYGITAY
ncbi:glideosome-associated protein 50-like [Danaus plexippus]|uniref:glideosome-associated protein 50-like n=1 Tax=Danaus plexippus TaxID=13037 RepID=UPI002AB0AB8B|nr:glideosome-associated protein 50-like [Danaus plexippus]